MKNALLALLFIITIGLGAAEARPTVIVGPGGVHVGVGGHRSFYNHYPRYDAWNNPYRYSPRYGRPYVRTRPGFDFHRPYYDNRAFGPRVRTPGFQLYIR